MKDRKSLAAWKVDSNKFPENGSWKQKLKYLIRYAILAPSGHNSQPWKYKIKDKEIEVWADIEKRRPAVDPGDRELYISLGSAVENLRIAADYFGLIYETELTPNGSPLLAARMSFSEGKKISENMELFEAIRERRTNRSEYEKKPLGTEMVEKLNKVTEDPVVEVKFLTKKDEIEKVAELIEKSDRIWYKTKTIREELSHWLSRDVLLGGRGVTKEALNLTEIAKGLRWFLSTEPKDIREKAAKNKRLASEAPALVVIGTKNDTISDWVRTGIIYQKFALKLTNMKLANAFFNSVIELKKQRVLLGEMLGRNFVPQLLLRIGYPTEITEHTPRLGLREIVV